MNEIRRLIWDLARNAAHEWAVRAARTGWSTECVYYRPAIGDEEYGAIVIAANNPPGFSLADPRIIRITDTEDSVTARVAEVAMRLPILSSN